MKPRILNQKYMLYFVLLFKEKTFTKRNKLTIFQNQFLARVFVFFLILFSIRSHSQKLILPGNDNPNDYLTNPSNSNFTDYSNQELVDLYTGMVHVNIPIYEIKDKDLKIPISLNYKKDGILVEEKAGNVGLGWTLNTVGYIRREVIGNPDEDIFGNHNGEAFYRNYGRFNDLPMYMNELSTLQLPIGNTGTNIMDDYIEIIKNNELFKCNLADPTNDDCEKYCQMALINRINNPSGSSSWDSILETQPDIFYYQVPTASGSFILDSNGNPKTISGTTDVVITPAIGPNADSINSRWTITTKDGITYFFPNSEEYSETTENHTLDHSIATSAEDGETKEHFLTRPTIETYNANSPDPNNRRAPRKENDLVNTWYPSKMTSSKFDTEISFTYESQAPIEEYSVTEQKMHYIKTYRDQYDTFDDQNEGCTESTRPTRTTTTYINQPTGNTFTAYANTERSYWIPSLRIIRNPKYLSNIASNNGNVNFNYDIDERHDLAGNYALQRITVRNIDGETIKNFEFNYDYFNALADENLQKSSRLKLTKFSEISVIGDKAQEYNFEYNEHMELPPYESFQQDYWGYFNANTTNTLIPSGSNNGIQFEGGNREPNEERMKVAMLRKITYPTGGYNEIQYEINKYKDKDLRLDHNIGGLRVKKTITAISDEDSTKITKEYLYGSLGFSQGTSVNFMDRNWYNNFQREAYISYRENQDISIDRHLYIRRSAKPIYPLLKTKGAWVGYKQVTVQTVGLGKTIFEFTNPLDTPDITGSSFKYPFRSETVFDPYHDEKHVSKDALRGLLKGKIDYNENGKIVRSEYLDYTENPIYHNQIRQGSMTIHNQFVVSGNWSPRGGVQGYTPIWLQNTKVINIGQIQSFFPYVSKRVIKTFDSHSLDHSLYEAVYQKNSSSHMQTTYMEFTGSDKKKVGTTAYYAGDTFPQDGLSSSERNAILGLKEQNRLEPVFIENHTNQSITGVARNVFDEINPEMIRIKKIQAGINKDSMSDQEIFSYNSFGNINETSKLDGALKVIYIWGYNEQLPIVKVEGNLTYEKIDTFFYNTFGKRLSFIKELSNSPSNNPILNEWLDKLRIAIGNYTKAAQISTYLHKPLIGITSSKDPRDNVNYYEYDLFNRLSNIKDSERNLITKSEYYINNTNN